MKNRITVALVVVAVGAGIWMWVANRGSDAGSTGSSAVQAPPVASVPAGQPGAAPSDGGFRDTFLLKPPAGAKVAVYEFDDLECPACARAFPIVHEAVGRYKIALVHHDFPLTEIHVWSFDAAVTARYLEDKVSLKLAEEFRGDVFANQQRIASKDDLGQFTGKWFASRSLTLPFVIDPSGSCQNEVKADRALGDRIGVRRTPCIFVVTQQSWTHVEDVNQLDTMIEAALAQTRAEARPVEAVKQQS